MLKVDERKKRYGIKLNLMPQFSNPNSPSKKLLVSDPENNNNQFLTIDKVPNDKLLHFKDNMNYYSNTNQTGN